jgi:DNA-binding NtrC family response regulator
VRPLPYAPALELREEFVHTLLQPRAFYCKAKIAETHVQQPVVGPARPGAGSYAWPGNVRELANAVERAVILCRGNVLQPTDFDQQIRDAAAHPGRPAIVPNKPDGGRSIEYNLDAIERLAIERALAATGGNRTRAARLLGISERTLRNKLNSPREASGG